MRTRLSFSWPGTAPAIGGWAAALILAAMVLALGACSEQSGGTPAQGPQAVTVRAVKVGLGPISESVFVEGTARAVRREYLYFQRTGRVVWVTPGPGGRELREGDPVRKGQVLARLDARISDEDIRALKAAVEEARTHAKQAHAELDRRARLYEKKTIAPETYQSYQRAAEAADAQVASAEARLRQSRVHGGQTALVAPIDGIIAYLNVKEGYFSMGPNIQAQSESELLNMIPMVVVDPSQYEITVEVPFFESKNIQPGAPAVVGGGLVPPPGQEGGWTGAEPIPAQVFSINPAVDPGSRHVQVKLRTQGTAPGLKDGMHMTGWVITRHQENAVLVPHEAVFFQDGRAMAWVVEGDRVLQASLELGLYDDNKSQVTKGLEPGQLVVTQGRYLLAPQSRVKVAEAPQAAKSEG